MGDEFEDTSVDTGSDMSDSGESFDDSSVDAGDEPIEDSSSEGLDDSSDVGTEDSEEPLDDNSMDAGDEPIDDAGDNADEDAFDDTGEPADTEADFSDEGAEGLPDDEKPVIDTDTSTEDSNTPTEEEKETADDGAEDLPDGDAEGTDESANQNSETVDNDTENLPENDQPLERANDPVDENAEIADDGTDNLPENDEPAGCTDEPVDENAEAADNSAADLPEGDESMDGTDAQAKENAEAIDNSAEDLPDGDAEKSDEPADPHNNDATNNGADGNESTQPNDRTFDDGTDWDRTSLTPEQEAQMKEMDDAGEIDIPHENPDWQEPEQKDAHLPTDKTGTFDGERGDSAFHPNDQAALDKMNEYGRDTVDYCDGHPDFSPFTQHDTPYGQMDGQVEIPHMTENRENPAWDYGRRPAGTSHDPNYDLGNFAQADNALSEKMGNMTPEQVEAYRKDNGLTWHECPDGKTMQLVPTEIHDACRHSGGVSEQKYRQAMGDITAPIS